VKYENSEIPKTQISVSSQQFVLIHENTNSFYGSFNKNNIPARSWLLFRQLWCNIVFGVTSTVRSKYTLQNAETFMAKATGKYSDGHATPRRATLLYATPRHATQRHATPRYSTPRHATLLYATPRYSTPRHATLRHATPRHATLRNATPRHSGRGPADSARLSQNCKLCLPIGADCVRVN